MPRGQFFAVANGSNTSAPSHSIKRNVVYLVFWIRLKLTIGGRCDDVRWIVAAQRPETAGHISMGVLCTSQSDCRSRAWSFDSAITTSQSFVVLRGAFDLSMNRKSCVFVLRDSRDKMMPSMMMMRVYLAWSRAALNYYYRRQNRWTGHKAQCQVDKADWSIWIKARSSMTNAFPSGMKEATLDVNVNWTLLCEGMQHMFFGFASMWETPDHRTVSRLVRHNQFATAKCEPIAQYILQPF